jgi:serine/threonine protein kinase
MIGRSIENYKIVEKLSRAGEIEVYKAVNDSLGRKVVIKTPGLEVLQRSEIAENFRSEAATLAKISHSCIPTFHSLNEINGELFVISEFAEGETLDRILLREGKFSVEKAVPIFAQVFDCVEYTNKYGIVHGGLKTSKIVLNDAGNIKILGYGVSESVSDETGIQNDIYALAAMLYETLTGKSLFDAEKEFESSIPESIESVISQALSPFSNETFQSVSEFRNVLITNGFVNSVAEKADDVPKITENTIENNTAIKNDEKVASVFAIDFSKRKGKFAERFFRQNSIQSDDLKNNLPPQRISGKSRQTRYKIAGGAILAMIILHFVWQFSFIQSEKLRVVETLVTPVQPEKLLPDVKTAKQTVAVKPDLVAENSAPINSEKIVQPTTVRQSEIKSAPVMPKKKAILESKNDRLRRAEKLLTGF